MTAKGSAMLEAPVHDQLPAISTLGKCDRACPATARVQVVLIAGGSLLFCGHHYREIGVCLLPVAMVVYDESEWNGIS